MRLHADAQTPLLDTCRLVEQTAPAVQRLLTRHFPGCGARLCPDDAGHVRVAEERTRSPDMAASEYAHVAGRLHGLAGSFTQALLGQAHVAGILLAKERPVLSCALDLARHPLDRRLRKVLAARIMPAPRDVHRHDDATASCIWIRLWTLHAWVLELILTIDLSGDAGPAETRMLRALDRHLGAMTAAHALWLSVAVSGGAAPAFVLARAPAEAMPVGNLAWPDRLGAAPADEDDMAEIVRLSHATGISGEDGRFWLKLGPRYAELPARCSPPASPMTAKRRWHRLRADASIGAGA
jgi:hypothetical protein